VLALIAPIRCPWLMSNVLLLAEALLMKTLRGISMQGLGLHQKSDQAGILCLRRH